MQGQLDAYHGLISFAVALPLFYAAVAKLLDPGAFSMALPLYRLPAPALRPTYVRALGLLEYGLAVGLVTFLAPWSAALAFATYLVFAAVLTRARLLGAEGECGCFGGLGGRIDRLAIARNAALAVAAFALILMRSVNPRLAHDGEATLLATIVATIGTAVVETALAVRRTIRS